METLNLSSMPFALPKSLEILQSTPGVLVAMLGNLSADWITRNEGENTWNPKDIVAHLIICEKTNWLARARIILSDSLSKTFTPIDMTAHVELAQSRTLSGLLSEFQHLRANSIREVTNLNLTETDLARTAIHPKLGEVNLQQLLAAWVTHDLSHIAQISRVLAKHHKEQVGPFIEFLRILNT